MATKTYKRAEELNFRKSRAVSKNDELQNMNSYALSVVDCFIGVGFGKGSEATLATPLV